MALDQLESNAAIDIREQLEHALRQLFQDSFSDFDLRFESDQYFQGRRSAIYELNVHVSLCVASLLKRGSEAFPPRRELYVGPFVPHSFTTYRDFEHGHTVLCATYRINDLSLFISELNKLAWDKYSQQFTVELEKALTDQGS